MTLPAGTRLGPYQIVALIGAGGMGEVYRARDGKLNRDVAIKVLPAAFAQERERVARFEREAQTLAALNHQNIAQVFGVTEEPLGLVMELVEGQELSGRIGARGMDLDEALPIARQIADALEAAHERGVVHRDLKPANIKVRDDGVVKVLDFGLAKAMDSGGVASALANSPTFMTGATQIGTILGTAAYMSPEQAKGKAVDKRSDIWSFGAVLFEMLAGRRPFEGDTITEILGAIIHKAPDLSVLPATTPAPVVALIARCLEKDVTRRLRDIGEARVALESSSASMASHLSAPVPGHVSARPNLLRRALVPIVVIASLAAGIAIGALTWRRAEIAQPLHLSIALPAGFFVTSAPVISPDGSTIAFTGITERDGTSELYLRRLDSFDTQRVAASKGASSDPFFSPDSRFVAFFANGALRHVRISDGGVSTIAELPRFGGGVWTPDGHIVFSEGTGSGILRVSIKGGPVETLTTLSEGQYAHVSPQLLDNGVIVFRGWRGGDSGQFCRITAGDRQFSCVPSAHNLRFGADGYVLSDGQYSGIAAYKAGPGGPEGIEGQGEMVLRSVYFRPNQNRGLFSLSKSGALAYVPGSPLAHRVAWVDTAGAGATHLLTDINASYGRVSLSPDGRRIVYGGGGPLTVLDLERGTRTAIAGTGNNLGAFWSRDGKRVFFASNRDSRWSGYAAVAESGWKVTPIVSREYDTRLESEAPDGSLLLTIVDPKTSADIWLMRPGGAIEPLVVEPQTQSSPRFSPSGRHLAFVSNVSGRSEVHVRPIGSGETVQVSTQGGNLPTWSRDGVWLYYSQAATIMRVAIDAAGRPGLPQALMHRADLNGVSDTSLDGKQLLVVKFLPESIPSEVRIITNFIDEIRRAVK